jgi:hemerythrin-like domain-containing protein
MQARSSKRRTSRKGVDAIALLIQDHKKVKRLLKQLDTTTEKAAARRESLFKEINNELKIHTELEEQIFYPAYKEAAKKSDAHLYYEALEEHHLVDVVLPEIEASDVESEEFAAKAKVLLDLVEHHTEEEEKQMFPKARKVMGKEELSELGTQMQERKMDLQSDLMTRATRSGGFAFDAIMSRVSGRNRKKRAA